MQAKKKKQFMFRDKPLYRVGDEIYYGDLGEKYIMKLELTGEKVKLKIIENSGELGTGNVCRESDRPNLYSALDIGEWWLKMALAQ